MNSPARHATIGCHSVVGRLLLGVAFLLGAVVHEAASARCSLFVPTVGSAPAIDGAIDLSAEWKSASVTESGTGCFSPFFDGPAGAPIARTVTAYAMQDSTAIYLALRVQDSTANPGNLARAFAERIYVQYGQGTSGTASATKLIFTNTRAGSWPSAPSDAQSSAPNAAGTGWAAPTNLSTGGVVAIQNSATGYDFELKILKAGSAAYSLAFAVINDLGTPSSGTADAFDAHFPSTLTIATLNGEVEDPVNPVGDAGWKQQDKWAAVDSKVIAEIFLNPDPTYPWITEDIDVLNCNDPDSATGDRYSYYASAPCAFKVKVYLWNTGSADFRNILVVVSNTGTGVLKWQAVDFKESVNVAPGNHIPAVVTVNRLPQQGILTPGHPCVRVYVLPASLDQATLTKLRNANTSGSLLDQAADLDPLVVAFGLDVSLGGVGKQVGQQNISIATTAPTCPASASCPIGMSEPERRFAAVEGDSDRPHAIRAALTWPDVVGGKGSVEERKGVLSRLYGRYGKDHVVVFVSAFATSPVTGTPAPSYRIIQPIGGVTQLFPVTMLKAGPDLPVQFIVGNPTKQQRTVTLKAEVFYPAGYGQGRPTTITPAPIVLEPGQTQTVTQIAPSRDGSHPKSWLWWLLVVLIVVIALAFALKRRRPRP